LNVEGAGCPGLAWAAFSGLEPEQQNGPQGLIAPSESAQTKAILRIDLQKLVKGLLLKF
jgi:hypothetical protein